MAAKIGEGFNKWWGDTGSKLSWFSEKGVAYAAWKAAAAQNSTSNNTSSPKLPDAEEVFYASWKRYQASCWAYPPTLALIKWVLEFIAGKIGP